MLLQEKSFWKKKFYSHGVNKQEHILQILKCIRHWFFFFFFFLGGFWPPFLNTPSTLRGYPSKERARP